MIKQLNKLGNSHCLIIDKPLLDLLQIEKDTKLLITTDGNSLIISPMRKLKRVPISKKVVQCKG